MRRRRSVQLSDKPSTPAKRQAAWEKYIELPDGYERRWRRGKTLHILRVTDYKYANGRGRRRTRVEERLNAVVHWADILKCVKIKDDDDGDPPWQNCDGWDHTAERFNDERHHRNLRHSARYVFHDGRSYILTVDPVAMGLPDYAYYRAQGAAKQVARQLAAKALNRALRQLRVWYSDGWRYYGVVCEFRTYEASCWGIDDYDYAKQEVGPEIAGEVAHKLEADGYLVTGRPIVELHRGRSLESWRDEFQFRRNMFNMEPRS